MQKSHSVRVYPMQIKLRICNIAGTDIYYRVVSSEKKLETIKTKE